MVAALHEQPYPSKIQEQQLADRQRSADTTRFPDHLVRSGFGVGAATDRQTSAAAKV